MGESPVGVLAMAYGTPERPEGLEAYYTDIRRGRPPTPELLADLRRRYEAIGGLSPLAERTRAQVAGLAAELGARAPGRYRVELGLKHARPSIEDGLAALAAAGCRVVRSLVLAPHHSALSSGQYHERAEAAGRAHDPRVAVERPRRWHADPALVALLAERVADALSRFPPAARVELLVTAHSLPERALTLDDPSYPDQLAETGAAVAARAGVEDGRWRVAWQSAGRTPEPWIGPDILTVIRALAVDGVEGVAVCPAGFVSDHLEVLYDVDIEARRVAEEAGLQLERTESLNDDPRFLSLLADLVA